MYFSAYISKLWIYKYIYIIIKYMVLIFNSIISVMFPKTHKQLLIYFFGTFDLYIIPNRMKIAGLY